MQRISPLIKQIGQLIDVRIKTLKINIIAEIKDSEERVTKSLKAEIKEAEQRLAKKLQAVEDKLDKKISDHKVRIEKLEKYNAQTTI